jgi:prolyl-tRNA synthetase
MAKEVKENKKQEEKKGITVKKADDLPEWYEQVCLKAEVADFGPVKGTMVIRPRGYAIWQAIQDYFNENIIKKTNVKNAYFPLFVPESFFKKEAKHAEGFSPEVAWIDKEISGEGERIAIRPTSETIIYDSYSKWIRSWRDLPLKMNQWCNVVRWETETTKLLLRSREFLWQEGHCVYETEKECVEETVNYLKLYQKLCEELLALPVIPGEKSKKETFAGAKKSYTIEGFMPDGKALQCGTAHNLGQGFAKSFNISYLGRDGEKNIPWQNSWGISTRLIGATIMTHSDDKGLVLPPRIVENKLVIVPIIIGDDKTVLEKAREIAKQLEVFNPILDDRLDYAPGYKYNEWEMKGIPLRLEIGPRDLKENKIILVRRDDGTKESVNIDKKIAEKIEKNLEDIHKNLFNKAQEHIKNSIIEADKKEEFLKAIEKRKLVLTNFCGEEECEDEIKDKTGGASSRCIPLNTDVKKGSKCFYCNKPAKVRIYFSKSY